MWYSMSMLLESGAGRETARWMERRERRRVAECMMKWYGKWLVEMAGDV